MEEKEHKKIIIDFGTEPSEDGGVHITYTQTIPEEFPLTPHDVEVATSTILQHVLEGIPDQEDRFTVSAGLMLVIMDKVLTFEDEDAGLCALEIAMNGSHLIDTMKKRVERVSSEDDSPMGSIAAVQALIKALRGDE